MKTFSDYDSTFEFLTPEERLNVEAIVTGNNYTECSTDGQQVHGCGLDWNQDTSKENHQQKHAENHDRENELK